MGTATAGARMTTTDHQDDDVTIALFITQGLIEQDPDGTWKLTEAGRLTLSNNQHKLPNAPLSLRDELGLGRILASFGSK
jgi:hypothetical protein